MHFVFAIRDVLCYIDKDLIKGTTNERENESMSKRILSLLLAAMMLSMSACGAAEKPVEEKPAETPAAPVETPAAPATPSAPAEKPAEETKPELSGTMSVIATNESYMQLFDKFAAETGVKVELLSMSSGDVLSKLRAEGGTPSADLWFGGGIDSFMSAAKDGLLESVEFEAANEIESQFKDAENRWFSKGLTIVGFLVNNTLLAENNMEMPTTWEALTDEQYKEEIVMSSPAISGTNYGAVNSILQTKGEEEGWKYFEAFNENVAYYTRRGSDPKNKVIADEITVGITFIDNTITVLTEDYDVTVVYPEDGIPWIPDGVAVFKNAANVEAAKYFVEWLYSNDENLCLLAEIDGKTTIKGIKPSLEGVELDYDPASLMALDLTKVGSEREAILAKFEPLMGDKVVAEDAK